MKFCIVGTGRCGTTLLWRILNLHPHLFVYKETHWIPQLIKRYEDKNLTSAEFLAVLEAAQFANGQGILAENIRRHKVDQTMLYLEFSRRCRQADGLSVREYLDCLGTSLCKLSSKRVWGDKTPSYGLHAPLLSRLWPECLFIHIVRDGYAVGESMEQHNGFQFLASRGAYDFSDYVFDRASQQEQSMPKIEDFFQLWATLQQKILAQLEQIPKQKLLQIRYEDLLQDPKSHLSAITKFLKIDADPIWQRSVLDEIREDRRVNSRSRYDDIKTSELFKNVMQTLKYDV